MFSENSTNNNFNGHIFLSELPENAKPNMAIFLSGGGSNAEKLLADDLADLAAAHHPPHLLQACPLDIVRLPGQKYNIPDRRLPLQAIKENSCIRSCFLKNLIDFITLEERILLCTWPSFLRTRRRRISSRRSDSGACRTDLLPVQ